MGGETSGAEGGRVVVAKPESTVQGSTVPRLGCRPGTLVRRGAARERHALRVVTRAAAGLAGLACGTAKRERRVERHLEAVEPAVASRLDTDMAAVTRTTVFADEVGQVARRQSAGHGGAVAHCASCERLDDLGSVGAIIWANGSGQGHRGRGVEDEVEVRALG